MKKLILGLTVACITLYSCKESAPDKFTVNGTVTELHDPFIYLQWRVGDSTHVDSAAVTNGKFSFTGQVIEPTMAIVYLANRKGYDQFFLQNADIHIEGSADSLTQAKITGSPSQDEFEDYKSQLSDLSKQQDDLFKQYSEARNNMDSAALADVTTKLDKLNEEQTKATKVYIAAHPKSFVSLSQLEGLAYGTPYAELNKLFTGLDASVQQSQTGKKFADRLATMAKTAVGQPAIDFTQNDVNGKAVSLADFKGKYVLVDFWASWCGPCRAENPNVVKAYNQYKDKGFTVLGVSLDDSGNDWKEAIDKDNLAWTQVSDLKGWKNEAAQKYGVNAIPANYLLNPDGKIIGHNLRGKDLEDKLAEVMK